jgi:hypothetical protein
VEARTHTGRCRKARGHHLLRLLLLSLLLVEGQASAKSSLAQEPEGVWREYQAPTETVARDLDMLSDQYGWAAGGGSRTSSGRLIGWNRGQWNVEISPIEAALSGIAVVSETEAWAVGLRGTILRWDGFQWSPESSPTTHQLASVSMASADEGWAVGGYVPRPTNAGQETQVILRWDGQLWQRYREGPGSFLYEVKMLSANDGWIVGRNGTILRWNGTNWRSLPVPTRLGVKAVDMITPDHGWAVGGDSYNGYGFFLRWDGSRWTEVASPIFSGLTDVEMVSADDGWATGGGNALLRWDGQSWREVEPPAAVSGAIDAVGGDSVWFAASNGLFLRHQTQETPPVEACGTWARQESGEEKDQRIQVAATDADVELPCGATFRLKNETDFYTFGGYTMSLIVQPSNTDVGWVPDLGDTPVLPPILDIESHVTPIDANMDASVAVEGEISVRGAAVDSALFLLRGALTLSPVTDCVIPDEAILAAGLRTSVILEQTVSLALRGEFLAAYREFVQIGAHFYEESADALAEIGYECGFDILIDLAKKPFQIAKIAADWVAWVGKVYWDYWEFQGQSADVTLVYAAPMPPSSGLPAQITETEVILIEPITYEGEAEGSCWTPSLATFREGAWRCMVGNRIQDPCFSSAAFPDAVICHPSHDGTGGFKLNLTEPLPTNWSLAADASAWIFELADGATCRVASTGTSAFAPTGRSIRYACDDGTQIEGSLNTGAVWTAKRVRVSEDMSTVEELGQVTIRTVWR